MLGDHDLERSRVGRELGREACAQPLAVVAPDLALELRDAIEVAARVHTAQRDALRQPDVAGRRLDGCDQHGLGLLRREAGGLQPRREVAREVVAVQLPLEPLAPCREDLDLAFDQRVQLAVLEPGEVAVEHEASAVEAREPVQRAVALDRRPRGERPRPADAQPGVVGGEQLVGHGGHTSRRAPARTIERRASARSPMSSPSTSAGSGASQRMTASSMSCT